MSISDKKWQLKENKVDTDLIKNNPDIDPVILNLLNSRGLNIDEIKSFLKPDYKEQLHDPFLFKNMKKVVELVFKHLKRKNKIVIYGDYDADGITATAVIYKTLEFLISCSASSVLAEQDLDKYVDIYIPHRETEGYGVNKNAIEEIAKNGAKLIITVDTGIRSIDEIALAKEKGMDVILTDHHEPGDEIPDCLIINPKVSGEKYPFRELAGVGVAFKVAQALLSFRKVTKDSSPLPQEEGAGGEGAFEKWLLDYVVIGTIADLVPLVNENRVLTHYGLIVLNKTKRLGIKKLIDVANSSVDKNGDKKEIDAWQIGFQLAPRLNAAGRLGHASNAYQLLVTDDKSEAIKIAEELDKTNKERQNITQEIFEQADKNIETDNKILFAVAPFLSKEMSEGVWPAGVMGLVSGKLTEKYYRPSLAITDKQGEIVGSARSISEFDITEALEQCAEFLINYGGHKQAAGFTVKKDKLKEFLNKMTKVAEEKLKDVELVPTLEIDSEINFGEINEELFNALQRLKPFGVKNPQPKFISKNLQVVNSNTMGIDGQHLKLKVKSQKSKVFDAIAFSVPDEWKNIKVGDVVDMVYYVDMNEWNGSRSVQLKIIDVNYNANTSN